MAEATATLESADRTEPLDALERLTQATQALVDSPRADAAPGRQVAARQLESLGLGRGS